MTPIVTRDIEAAAQAIEAGLVIGLPTDTVYGIGVDPTRRDATDLVFAVKRRPDSMSLPVLVGDPDAAERLAEITEGALRLIERWWPGGLTIVLARRMPGPTGAGSARAGSARAGSARAGSARAGSARAGPVRAGPVPALHLGGDDRTVGVRCPANEAARELLRRTGPLAVTSANRHGEVPAATPSELAAALGEGISLVLDGGRCDGAPSTVVSLVDPGEPVCLRVGAVAVADLEETIGRPITQLGA